MRVKIEIVADDALGMLEEVKRTCESSLKGEDSFRNVMEMTWIRQLREGGLKPVSVKFSVVEEGEGAKP